MTLNSLKFKLTKSFPALGRLLKVKYGLILEDLKEEDYVMGAEQIIKKKLKEDGDWTAYVPNAERQSGRNVETMSCTIFGLWNAIETLARLQYGEEWDKSDRFNAKMVGITQNGGTMANALESVRKNHGAVDQPVWPNGVEDFTWSQYFANIPSDVLNRAKQFLNDYELKYEAVYPHPNAIREALKYSPLYVAGYAWYKSGSKYYTAGQANHCFMLAGMKDDGDYIAYDTYEPFFKILDKSFAITYPKLLVLRKKTLTEFNEGLINDLMKRGLKFIMRVLANGEIYKLEPGKLTYISPEDWNKYNVEQANQNKELVGISEDVFNQLIR
jgi:hypothetical protein